MDFLPNSIDQYVEQHTAPESELLMKINRETHLEVLRPRMLSGHLQGRVLSMVSHMVAPKNILEIGTYTGYSALCLAEGLHEHGKLVTIECNEELESKASGYFAESTFSKQIELIIGDAIKVIPQLDTLWDLIFIDADKESYMDYFKLCIDRVRTGGFIMVDNVLWSGKVANNDFSDKATATLQEFNKMVHEDSRVENVLLPIRDGIMILRKL